MKKAHQGSVSTVIKDTVFLIRVAVFLTHWGRATQICDMELNRNSDDRSGFVLKFPFKGMVT